MKIPKRLFSEVKRMKEQPPEGVLSCEQDEHIPLLVYIRFKGPKNTPYEQGIFKLCFIFSIDYPFKPPNFMFITKIYHPNFTLESGETCGCCFVKNDWAPTKQFKDILLPVINKMKIPSDKCPCVINWESWNEFQKNMSAYIKKCQKYVNQYAKD